MGAGPSTDPVSFNTESGKFYKISNPLKSHNINANVFFLTEDTNSLHVNATVYIANDQTMISIALKVDYWTIRQLLV